jgi:hypothetical protein
MSPCESGAAVSIKIQGLFSSSLPRIRVRRMNDPDPDTKSVSPAVGQAGRGRDGNDKVNNQHSDPTLLQC